MRPRIGVTGSVALVKALGTRRTFLNEPYVLAVEAAGGLPIVVTPAHGEESLEELQVLLDGLLLTGGEDVEPWRYRRTTPHPTVVTVPERDAVEFRLLARARADGLPVLAICRGIQVLNVALGGTLYQDLPSEHGEVLRHDQSKATPPVPRVEASHRVRLEPGSALAAIVGHDQLGVNSMHHQAIRELAPGLVTVGEAPDGVIEAVEAERDGPFLIGVQWHPEELAAGGDAPSRRLFQAFVSAAAKRQRRA